MLVAWEVGVVARATVVEVAVATWGEADATVAVPGVSCVAVGYDSSSPRNEQAATTIDESATSLTNVVLRITV